MSTEPALYVAQIVKDDTGEIVYQSNPTHRRQAERIEDGMGINLNWAEYSTRVLPAEEGQ